MLSKDALGQDGLIGVLPDTLCFLGRQPRSSFNQMGECQDILSPLWMTPEPVTSGKSLGLIRKWSSVATDLLSVCM